MNSKGTDASVNDGHQSRRPFDSMDLNMTEVRSVRIICDPALKDGVLKQLNDLVHPALPGGKPMERDIERPYPTSKRCRAGNVAWAERTGS